MTNYGSGTGPKSGGGIRCFVAASYAEAIRKSVASEKGRPKNMIPTGYGWLRLALTSPPATFLNPTDSPMEIDLVTDFCAITPNQFNAPGTRSVGTLEENRILPHRTAVTIRIGPEFYEVARLNGRFRQTMAVGVEDKLEPVGEIEF